MTVVAGVKALSVDGVDYTPGSSAKYDGSDIEVESLIGGAGRIGRAEKAAAPYIEVDIHLNEGQSSQIIKATRDATVELRLADRTVVLTGADYVARGEIDGTTMGMTARFEGRKLDEVF